MYKLSVPCTIGNNSLIMVKDFAPTCLNMPLCGFTCPMECASSHKSGWFRSIKHLQILMFVFGLLFAVLVLFPDLSILFPNLLLVSSLALSQQHPLR
eukprot:TRINITY_DN7421_c0_g1_i1.p1 TRINITY_DN7421_c0_g1~~TRINITY_DN7421_c0_g1_i1.p1  ORF type:complete len:97 (-),score=2.71 TRINITY_DN7421_c0_g1_i1:90-380(-)